MHLTERNYSNDEVTVYWKPHVCEHSEICFRGLPRVFNPKRRPWVNMEGATTEKIIDQVKKCPSGALSYSINNAPAPSDKKDQVVSAPATELTFVADGPIRVTGDFVIIDSKGNKIDVNGKASICRCGASLKKPFCDGNHRKIGFKDL